MTTFHFDLVLLLVILGGGVWGLIAGAFRISMPVVLIIASGSILYSYPRVSALFKGPDPAVKLFLYIFIGFAALVIVGGVMRIIRNAVAAIGLGPVDKIVGLLLGLIAGALLAGSLTWGIETYGDSTWRSLLQGSELAASALAFFTHIMAFTDRLFPQPDIPWWKRPLW